MVKYYEYYSNVSRGKRKKAQIDDQIITSADKTMMRYMLHFMQEAIAELLKSSEELDQLNRWVADKHQMVSQGRLKLIVEHTDIFGQFSNSYHLTSMDKGIPLGW